MDLAQPLKRIRSYVRNPFKKSKIDRDDFILYKIVDSYLIGCEERYRVQCINTKVVLEVTLDDMVFDLDILHGLHPVQACFIGIEYAKLRKTRIVPPKNDERFSSRVEQCLAYRYGSKRLLYQKRGGHIGFVCLISGKEFIMDPRDIALSRELIEAFDAAQAFCIGMMAGNKLINPVPQSRYVAKPLLRLVKG